MSLKYKLFITLLAIGLIPFLFVGLVSYANVRKILTEEAMMRMDSIKSSKVEQIEEYLLFDKEQLRLISSRTQMRQLAHDYGTKRNKDDFEKLSKIIADIKSAVENISEISILDKNGIVLASTEVNTIGQDVSDQRYYVLGKVHDSVDIFFNDNNRLGHYLSGPLLLEDQLVGVVMIKTNARHYLRLFTDYDELGKTGEALFALREGNFAVYTHPLRFDPDAAFKRKVSLNDISKPVTRSLTGQQGVYSNTRDYREVSVYSATHYFEELDAAFVVKIDVSEVLSPIKDYEYSFIIISFSVLTFIIIIASTLTRAITQPVTTLLNVISKISYGDFTTAESIKITSKDEIGQLAWAFKVMTKKLAESYGLLEKKVTERTQELIKAKQIADMRANEAERLSNLMVGRELKMVELKQQLEKQKNQK